MLSNQCSLPYQCCWATNVALLQIGDEQQRFFFRTFSSATTNWQLIWQITGFLAHFYVSNLDPESNWKHSKNLFRLFLLIIMWSDLRVLMCKCKHQQLQTSDWSISCNGSAPYVWQIQTSNNQNRKRCTHLISKFKPATIKIGNVLENELTVHTNTWWIFLELFREFF